MFTRWLFFHSSNHMYSSFLQSGNSLQGAEHQSYISDSTLDVRFRWTLFWRNDFEERNFSNLLQSNSCDDNLEQRLLMFGNHEKLLSKIFFSIPIRDNKIQTIRMDTEPQLGPRPRPPLPIFGLQHHQNS